MTSNPYESPSTIEIQPDIQADDIRVLRPMGISILAVLHLLGGLLLLGMQFLLFAHLRAMGESLRQLGNIPAVLIVGSLILAVLAIASGIGMWIGARWGWWLGAFYQVYGVFRNGEALVGMAMMAGQLEAVISSGPEYYMIKHGGRVIIHAALLLYFFKGNVLAFFGLASLPKIQAIVILVGVCLAIIAGTLAIGLPWHVTMS